MFLDLIQLFWISVLRPDIFVHDLFSKIAFSQNMQIEYVHA
jgi:hypothetical protein